MKKKLTLLTGIAVLIAILSIGSCNRVSPKSITEDNDKTLTKSELPPEISEAESTIRIIVYDIEIGCRKHLEMQDDTDTGRGKKVIDSLTTVVHRGETVVWAKDDSAKLRKIHQVRIIDSSPWKTKDSCLEAEEIKQVTGTYLKFVIPSDADTGTVKYEIIFEDRNKNYWYIDPHLRIPPS